MPHFPKPFYKKKRRRWYVEIDRIQHNLGPDKDQAFERYHELMASARPPETKPEVPPQSVLALIDKFLGWCEKNRAPDTYRWYKDRLEVFACDGLPSETLTVDALKPYMLQEWIDGMDGVVDGTRRNYCRAVQRVMSWAEKLGYIDRSPIAHFEKPPGGKRDVVISDEIFAELLSHLRPRQCRDLVTVSWETGCRAQEIIEVEARHVELAKCRWVFPVDEEKMERIPRAVYLPDKAKDITERLVGQYPDGRLFRNTQGKPWTADAINCMFSRLKKKMGGRKYCLTHFRHTWSTKALEKGTEALTVAFLLGHADPSMLAKVYSHLSPEFLLSEVRRIAG